MKTFLLWISLMLSLVDSFSQKPDWIDFDKRNVIFPNEKYLIGYYSVNRSIEIPEEDQLKTLIEYAKTDIVENISVSIFSVSQLNTLQVGKSFTQSYSQQSLVSAKAELAGLKTEVWKDKKELFALAYVLRSDLISFYNQKIANLQTTIYNGITHAEKLMKSDNKEGSLDQYYKCSNLMVEAQQASAILLGLQKEYSNSQLNDFEFKVQSGIESILGTTPVNPDDATLVIAEAIKKQIQSIKMPIKLAFLTYQNTRMASPFSAYFTKNLESKLTMRGLDVDLNQSVHSKYILSGTYWEDADKLRLLVILNNIENGKVVASSETSIPIVWFTQNQQKYLPENFQEASMRQKIFSKDEIIDGGLHLDLWTNKGDENLMFFENETMRLTVRVSHECYLRFIYYMADGSKVLLMDDYYISSDKVNKPIEIPETFTCAAPFGVENLQLNAQTVQFEKLIFKMNDGYKYILDDNSTIQLKTRGFKRQENNVLKAEKRLTMTTLNK